MKVFWINGSGEGIQYGSVQPGKEVRFETYVGHVWRVEGESGRKAVYRAVEGEGFIVVDFGTKLVCLFGSFLFVALAFLFYCISGYNIERVRLIHHLRSL